MPLIKVNRDDLGKYRLIQNVGWKLLEVIEVPSEGKPSQDGESTNYFVDIKVVGPKDEDQGIQFGHCCNTKGAFAIIPFVAACLNMNEQELFGSDNEVDLDLNAVQGKLFEGFCGHRQDNKGELRNTITEFAPAGTHFPDLVGTDSDNMDYTIADDDVPF